MNVCHLVYKFLEPWLNFVDTGYHFMQKGWHQYWRPCRKVSWHDNKGNFSLIVNCLGIIWILLWFDWEINVLLILFSFYSLTLVYLRFCSLLIVIAQTTSSATIPFFNAAFKSLHDSFTLPSLHKRSRTTEQLETVGNIDLASISL